MTTTTLPTRADELRVRLAALVEQAISERSSVWAVARDARIPRSTLTRRLKGQEPSFYPYELEKICRVLEVSMVDLVKAAES